MAESATETELLDAGNRRMAARTEELRSCGSRRQIQKTRGQPKRPWSNRIR